MHGTSRLRLALLLALAALAAGIPAAGARPGQEPPAQTVVTPPADGAPATRAEMEEFVLQTVKGELRHLDDWRFELRRRWGSAPRLHWGKPAFTNGQWLQPLTISDAHKVRIRARWGLNIPQDRLPPIQDLLKRSGRLSVPVSAWAKRLGGLPGYRTKPGDTYTMVVWAPFTDQDALMVRIPSRSEVQIPAYASRAPRRVESLLRTWKLLDGEAPSAQPLTPISLPAGVMFRTGKASGSRPVSKAEFLRRLGSAGPYLLLTWKRTRSPATRADLVRRPPAVAELLV